MSVGLSLPNSRFWYSAVYIELGIGRSAEALGSVNSGGKGRVQPVVDKSSEGDERGN
jgi:hypothetical protein